MPITTALASARTFMRTALAYGTALLNAQLRSTKASETRRANNDGEVAVTTESMKSITVRNAGEPLRFVEVEPLAGFAAEAGRQGQSIGIWTKLALTSDEPLFHVMAEGVAGILNHMAKQSGQVVNLRRTTTVLLILKPDKTAEVWCDTAAVAMHCAVKRSMSAGSMVFDNDIADITAMSFPCITFGSADKVLCLFRQDWRFGLAFDMNPDGNLDIEAFNVALGSLYRHIRYRHLYDALGDTANFDRLLTSGWFPFIEIIAGEFKELWAHHRAGFDLVEIEEKVTAQFDATRTERILQRWTNKPHFAKKAELLKTAITAFNARQPVSTIKILLTEIEGILNDAHRAAFGGAGARLKELLVFAEDAAERRAGGANTLLFPKAFGRYLREYTFADFDPVAETGSAGSRHAVGHGAASQDSYTMPRALQVMLTLDQLAFYT